MTLEPHVELLARALGHMARGVYDVPTRFDLKDMLIVRGADADLCREHALKLLAVIAQGPDEIRRVLAENEAWRE